jgi:hypothetical protein
MNLIAGCLVDNLSTHPGQERRTMKKLGLTLDDLRVDSFETSPAEGNSRGTVRGYVTNYREATCDATNCGPCDTNQGCGTEWMICGTLQCDYTVGYSCGGTCGQSTCYGDSCVCWTSPPYC